MKIHNLTKAIFFVAIIEIVLTFIWFNKYPDLSQAFIYVGMGALLFIFAYIYEWMKRFQENINEQEKMLNSFDLWVRQEFKKINKNGGKL